MFEVFFETGKDEFLRGNYRASITAFEQALETITPLTRQGGEVQMWLVNAYQANNNSETAIALCRQLMTHPHLDTAQKAKRLLYILEAPQLQRPKEWMTQIPTLDNVTDVAAQYVSAKPNKTEKILSEEDFEDLSQMNTEDNQFVWVALAAIALMVGSSWLWLR